MTEVGEKDENKNYRATVNSLSVASASAVHLHCDKSIKERKKNIMKRKETLHTEQQQRATVHM